MSAPRERRTRPDSPLALVRDATAEAHRRLEQRLDVARAPWGPAGHRVWLARWLGVQAPLEEALDAWAEQDPGVLDWPARRRADLMAADLRALGVPAPEVAALPRCPDPPLRPEPRPSRGQALGTCYVLDGSTLGGRLVRAAVVAAGVPAGACSSLTGRPGAGARWRETMQALDALEAAQVPAAAGSALAVFAALEDWLVPAMERR